MAWCDRGVQTLLATVGAFAAFSLMTIAIGTDYWLYSRAYICNGTNLTTDEVQPQPKTKKGDLTHSGLWRICCIEGKSSQSLDCFSTVICVEIRLESSIVLEQHSFTSFLSPEKSVVCAHKDHTPFTHTKC